MSIACKLCEIMRRVEGRGGEDTDMNYCHYDGEGYYFEFEIRRRCKSSLFVKYYNPF